MPTPTHSAIAERAYELWIQGGCLHGGDLADWLQAEAELSLPSVGGPNDGEGEEIEDLDTVRR